MATIDDVVVLASPFTNDMLDLKGNTWLKNSSSPTFPRISGGYLQIGATYTEQYCNYIDAISLERYRAWQITADVYFGSLGSSTIGEYMVFESCGFSFMWRGDNVANRLKVLNNGATLGYTSIGAYTSFNTITLEYYDSFFYLYVNGALVAKKYLGDLVTALVQNPRPFTLGNAGVTYSSSLRFNNVRIIQGAAPITEGLSDPGFTATATPRTLLDPATLTAAASLPSGRSGGIRRAAATPVKRLSPTFVADRLVVPNQSTTRLAKISGTVRAGAVPVSAPVVLLDRATMKPLADTLSDGTGAYQFDHIPADFDYLLVAKDTDAVYNAVVADRVTAVNY